ncbi:hypothetical protein [Paraglaciecola psychrophila]|uniref:Uncharacterized protein n=1 Tax=Paraglaciecola psychrophila 170 TaxID=1129794 RepID=K6YVT6_9ALTE|nr:hypothetical protein [Paraglaciecola psychrophila]AGH44515.1 hypothetical protein C427_2406 [Paraglaciecola psychrophila 170]GAC36809.1 hypothetical protein GPSY_1172 [Paraglaciecola psychrophila 170]
MTLYILAAILYLIAGRGVYSLVITISITARLQKVKGLKVFTILVWPFVVLQMGIK